jgi:hypothetical protein
LRHSRSGVYGPEEFEWSDEVRGQAQESTTLAAGFEDEMEQPMLEISQSAVHEPRRAARRAACEIVFFHERDTEATQCSVARDAASGDAATNDEEIEFIPRERRELLASRFRRRQLARGGDSRQIVLRVSGLRRAGASSRSYQSLVTSSNDT